MSLVGQEFKIIKENALMAVRINGKLLKYFPNFLGDKKVVSEAVSNNGLALQY